MANATPIVGGANNLVELGLVDTPEGPPPQRLRALPSRLTSQAATAADRIVDQALAEAGVRPHHYALLAALEEHGQAAPGRRTGIDRSDMVATVNDLAERQLCDRAPDPEDRRRDIITIAEANALVTGTSPLRCRSCRHRIARSP